MNLNSGSYETRKYLKKLKLDGDDASGQSAS